MFDKEQALALANKENRIVYINYTFQGPELSHKPGEYFDCITPDWWEKITAPVGDDPTYEECIRAAILELVQAARNEYIESLKCASQYIELAVAHKYGHVRGAFWLNRVYQWSTLRDENINAAIYMLGSALNNPDTPSWLTRADYIIRAIAHQWKEKQRGKV